MNIKKIYYYPTIQKFTNTENVPYIKYNIESREESPRPYVGTARDCDFASYRDFIMYGTASIPKFRTCDSQKKLFSVIQ